MNEMKVLELKTKKGKEVRLVYDYEKMWVEFDNIREEIPRYSWKVSTIIREGITYRGVKVGDYFFAFDDETVAVLKEFFKDIEEHTVRIELGPCYDADYACHAWIGDYRIGKEKIIEQSTKILQHCRLPEYAAEDAREAVEAFFQRLEAWEQKKREKEERERLEREERERKERELKEKEKNRIKFVGDTYSVRNLLKELGAKWDPEAKYWYIESKELTDELKSEIIGKLEFDTGNKKCKVEFEDDRTVRVTYDELVKCIECGRTLWESESYTLTDSSGAVGILCKDCYNEYKFIPWYERSWG